MKIDSWVGPYKVRAFPLADKKQIYFNVQYYAPGQSLEKPPVLDRTVYITDDSAGRRAVFEFTHSLASYVATAQIGEKLKQCANSKDSLGSVAPNTIVLSFEDIPPNLLDGHGKDPEQAKRRNQHKRHEPER